jgi:membrane associated rhomboid family serine protease
VFPIRDDNPHVATPYATYGLIGANVLAWALLQGLGSEPALSSSVCRLGLIPAELLQSAPAGTSFPVAPGIACAIAGGGAWHTVLTSMFLHGGWMHLIGNMWFLWIFGNNVEDAMGHLRFVAFYLLSGIAAAMLQTAFDPGSLIPMVGASGAIGGVMGAYVLMYPRVHVHLLVVLGFYVSTIAVPAYFMLGYWFLLQVVSGSLAIGAEGGGVAFWAHVGGFAAGALLSFVFRDRELLARHPYYGWNRRSPTQNWHRVRRSSR